MTDRSEALLARALTDSVAERANTALGSVIDSGLLHRLVDAARYHRVMNMVHLSLKEIPGPSESDLREALERYYLHQIGHHLRALSDLRSLDAVLSERGIPWLLVKGPVLSETIYERSDLRVYNDLDVVIQQETFPAAIDSLAESGFDLLDRNWDLIRREHRAQLHLSLRLGTVADVHHHLLNRATVRHSLTLPMRDLFERSTPVVVGDVTVRTLDAEDTVLHLCIHASLAGGDRLLWMKDIEQSLRRRPVDWEEAIRRARSWRAGPLVGVVLERARSEIGAPVPGEVLAAMFGSRLRQAVSARIDRGWPASRSRGRTTPSIVWAQVVRDRWAATATAFVGRAMRRLRKTTHRGEEDWQHPTEHHGAASADLERARYLHEVEDEPETDGTEAS